MINALLATPESKTLEDLQQYLYDYCPQVSIQGFAHSHNEAQKLIRELHPDLLFIEKNWAYASHNFTEPESHATIVLSEVIDHTVHARARVQANGYLAKPLQVNELLQVVGNAQQWIRFRQEQIYQKQLLTQMVKSICPNDVIAIPTSDGIEFLKANEIIRCEGLQKYTLIITTEGAEYISPYNLGEFCKMLLQHGFFLTHKSHLINLRYIRKLSNEGSIRLRDGSHVPLSRRKRKAFLDKIRGCHP